MNEWWTHSPYMHRHRRTIDQTIQMEMKYCAQRNCICFVVYEWNWCGSIYCVADTRDRFEENGDEEKRHTQNWASIKLIYEDWSRLQFFACAPSNEYNLSYLLLLWRKEFPPNASPRPFEPISKRIVISTAILAICGLPFFSRFLFCFSSDSITLRLGHNSVDV